MVELTTSKGVKFQVDDDLAPLISKFKWRMGKYLMTSIDGHTVLLHRFVLELTGAKLSKNEEVDHVNFDKQDNRLCNLRPCTRRQNNFHRPKELNKTGYFGVSYFPKSKTPYVANIRLDHVLTYLGRRKTAKAAAVLRDLASVKYFGDFATLNFEERRDTYIRVLKRGFEPDEPRQKPKSSKYRGVYWNKNDRAWKVEVWFGGRRKSSNKNYPTEEAAARAYDAKAKELRGPKAKLNFPEEQGGDPA